MDNSKIMARIAKLASKTVENGCTMEEATAAAAMVQKLIAKYHVNMTEYQEEAEAIDKEGIGYTRDWQWRLMSALAENYCCEYICSKKEGNKQIYVMGRDTDRKTCIAMFNMFYPLIKQGIQAAKKEAMTLYGTTKGLEYSYSIGYIKAIKQELQKQCRALALVIPEEVTEAFNKEFNVKITRKKVTVNRNVSDFAENKGYIDGMEASRTKSIA